MHGRNVDLTSGKLVVGDIDDPLSGGGFGGGLPVNNGDTNFFPAPGIYDLQWGIGTYTNTDIGGILISTDPGTVSTPTPPPRLTNDFGGSTLVPMFLDEASLWWRKEVIDETNEVIQLIAVQVSDPSIAVSASFTDQTFYDGPNGGFLTAAVELSVGSTDFTTFQRVTNSLYILDQLGASTNRSLMQNLAFGTFRPGNFVVFRDISGLFGGGPPDNTNVPPNLLTGRQEITPYATNDVPYLNSIVSNDWAGYTAELESVAARLPVVPGAVVTNLGGQVEVNAQQLYLRNTRIRGEGFVTLTATNVSIGGSNIVDVPRISLDFGSGPGVLELNEMVPDTVERFVGDFTAYSTVFTNFYERYTTNVVTDPGVPPAPAAGFIALSVPGEPTTEIITNLVEVRFQVTMVDARGLQTLAPVLTYDLRLTSTNGPSSLFFNENLTIASSVTINAREVTFTPLSGLTTLSGVGFSYTNMINVRVFTNLGNLFINDLADLRTAQFVPYEKFFNGGLLFADGVDIWADEFGNTGTIISQSLIDIRSRTMAIDGGAFDAQGDIRLNADNATIANFIGTASGRFVLDVSQSLTDLGVAAPNFIDVVGGVELSPDRPSGDLLGTTIIVRPNAGDLASIVWSSDDRGPNADGFQNNLALGHLTLESSIFSLFEFLPSRPGAAMYIDVLEINGPIAESLSALTNGLILGMNVYYSDLVTTTPYSPVTADSLNRIFGPNAPFNFIWVPGFVGPNAVEVALGVNGGSSRMNRALRQSTVLDSDGDGIPNALDQYPLTAAQPGEVNGTTLLNVNRNAQSISFNLTGTASATYVVEYTTNLVAPDWKAISAPLSSTDLNTTKAFNAVIGEGSKQGYYRVRVVTN